jgi:hypothetical protein
LELRNQLIALLEHIIVLLVLIVRPVRFDDAFASHTINCAWNSLGCDEFRKITE